jgi:folate-binding protein YgfZ
MGFEPDLIAQLGSLEGGAGYLPLADVGLVRVAGPGHREALQRVLSQDVLGLRPGQGRLALLLASKGQFRALMAVFAGAESTLLLAPSGRSGELARSLSPYLLLSRCTAEPAAASALAVLGPRWWEVVEGAGADATAPADGGWLERAGVLWFGRTMLGVPGAVAAAGEPDALAAVEQAVRAAGAVPVSAGAVELERIRAGSPAWGAELTGTVLPPEAGIETETISTSKGCYIGQETIARMQTYGHPNRCLVGLCQSAGDADAPALPVPLTAAGEDKVRGTLTSWGWHPRHGGVALALVKRELSEPGTRLVGGGHEFQVTRLPIW